MSVGEAVQDMPSCAAERAHVIRGFLAFQGPLRFLRSIAWVDRDNRLFLGEENPVTFLLRQLPPGPVHIVSERDENIALVLAAPRSGPRRNGAFPDGQGIIRNHRLFRHLVDASQPVALRAGSLGGIGGERFGMENPLPGRVIARPRVKHSQEI